MLFDTHSHLQFKIFEKDIDQVVHRASKAGVKKILVCGTNLASSIEAVSLCSQFNGVYAAVGIHPHHVYEQIHSQIDLRDHLGEIELLLNQPCVLAVGEIGLDRFPYKKTKYSGYSVNEPFVAMQKDLLQKQMDLARRYHKSLIIHNRKASRELVEELTRNWDPQFKGKSVFHCVEPSPKILEFALKNQVYIGFDGDITFDDEKQEFIKQVPLELLVLETDSPFLTPNPLRATGDRNESANLDIVINFVASLLKIERHKLEEITYQNSLNLFNLAK